MSLWHLLTRVKHVASIILNGRRIESMEENADVDPRSVLPIGIGNPRPNLSEETLIPGILFIPVSVVMIGVESIR